jgi:hypothetical protein
MPPEWNALSDDLQLRVAQAALARAAITLASQAELLADEIENGSIVDRGGAEARRLFANLIRLSREGPLAPQGNA